MSVTERRCANGHAVAPTAAFCTQCGAATDLATNSPTCAYGHPVAPGAAFCTRCGAVVTAATGSASAPPTYALSFGSTAQGVPSGLPTAYPSPNYGAGAYAPVYAYVNEGPISGLAVASLIVSIVWLYGVTSVVAIVLAVMALRNIAAHHQRGRGLAITAIVLGVLGVLGGIGAISALSSRT